jgi:hydrogenase/urease accessory protein HupE
MTARPRTGIAQLGVAILILLVAASANAHQFNLTTARIVANPDRTVDVEVAMKGDDADRVAHSHIVDDASGLVREDALTRAAARIGAYVIAHAVILGEDGKLCEPGRPTAAADKDGVAVRTRWSCAAEGNKLRYRNTVLLDVSPAARQVVLLGSGTDLTQDLLDASRTETRLTEEAPPSLRAVIQRYTKAGIEHIFLGYDHIAFLTAVVLWARRLWPVVKVVTAFTIAHSITLSLAALDIVRIPSTIIEPAIAASIIYVAGENFLSSRIDKRWRDTFGFGLIHGFGFASALQEFGLPTNALVPALGAFNLGVEIGQVAIVSLILPVLLGIDRVLAPGAGSNTAPSPRGIAVYPISAAIVVLATFWFLSRTGLAA